MIRVAIVDDQPAIRQGLRMRLAVEPDIVVVGEAWDGESAVEMVDSTRPDVVIMDLEMPRMDGLAATRILSERPDPTCVIILSIHDEQRFETQAEQAGAAAFVLKRVRADALLSTIRQTAAGP